MAVGHGGFPSTPEMPVDARAMAQWYEQVQAARLELLASLDELRSRADNFLAVAALASTMFAALTPGSDAGRSDVDTFVGPVPGYVPAPSAVAPTFATAAYGNGSSTEPGVPAEDTAYGFGPATRTMAAADDLVVDPAYDAAPSAPARHGTTSQPGTVQREAPRATRYAMPTSVELIIPPGITSPNRTRATAGSPFRFTVTTTGTSVPSITEKGDLPKSLTFTDNADGNATISGTPRKAGVYHLTIRAKFGKGTNRYVVNQGFTLTVTTG
jgi:hypothetical protein